MERLVIIIAILLSILLGLYVITPVEEKHIVSQELRPYIKEWMADMDSSEINYEQLKFIRKIRIKQLNDDELGYTDSKIDAIFIDERVLRSGPYTARLVMYHELGHYAFDLEHECCAMMTARTNSDEEYYRTNWKTIKEEYLNACKK